MVFPQHRREIVKHPQSGRPSAAAMTEINNQVAAAERDAVLAGMFPSQAKSGVPGSAIVSPCERYRYELRRTLPTIFGPNFKRSALWILFNPSTAAATIDDHTSRKGIGFSSQWGVTDMVFGNLYGIRATDPSAVHGAPDPVGPDNDQHLARMIGELRSGPGGDLLILAWGGLLGPDMHKRVSKLQQIITESNAARAADNRSVLVPMCLGKTTHGAPRHPLMLAYTTELEPVDLRILAESYAYKKGQVT